MNKNSCILIYPIFKLMTIIIPNIVVSNYIEVLKIFKMFISAYIFIIPV